MFNDPMHFVIFGFVIIIAIGIGIAVTILLRAVNDSIKLKRQKTYIENISKESVEDIRLMLDSFIDECIDDYLVQHPELIYEHRISQQEEIDLRKAVAEMVQLRMSDAMFYKLALYYNRIAMGTIIGEKIYIKITNLTVQNHSK